MMFQINGAVTPPCGSERWQGKHGKHPPPAPAGLHYSVLSLVAKTPHRLEYLHNTSDQTIYTWCARQRALALRMVLLGVMRSVH